MVIQWIKEKGEAIIRSVPFLAVFSSLILLYDLFWAFYFKGDSSFTFKYWMQVGIFYICFIIITILIGYIRKNNIRCNIFAFVISELYLIVLLFLGYFYIIYSSTFTLALYIIFFSIPIIFMLSDTFRFTPADECLIEIINYSEPSNKSEFSKKEKCFINQNDKGKFTLEQVPPEKVHPVIKITTYALIVNILFYWVWQKNHPMYYAIGLTTFFIYIALLLTHYKKRHYYTLSKLGSSVNINLESMKSEIFDKFIRRTAYIVFYSYFIYWIFSESKFFYLDHEFNYFEIFILALKSIDLMTLLSFLLYFLATIYNISMVSDGFGIVPIICNISREISSKITNIKKINIYHPDKSAGFKPLGNFCFEMSLLISLPFILGMPVQFYRYSTSSDISETNRITTFLSDYFNVAFIGVGIAGGVIFVFSIIYINKLIEAAKEKNLESLLNLYTKEFKNDPSSPKLENIDNAIKKIEGIILPPYGKTNFIRFYSALLVPSISILVGLKII